MMPRERRKLEGFNSNQSFPSATSTNPFSFHAMENPIILSRIYPTTKIADDVVVVGEFKLTFRFLGNFKDVLLLQGGLKSFFYLLLAFDHHSFISQLNYESE